MAYRAKRHRIFALACFAVGAFALLSPQASAAECAKETRSLALGDGVAAVRSYICRSGKSPLVSVEFHRLDEISTVGLFKDAPTGPLQQILGSAPIEKNALYAQLDDLFERFGQKPTDDSEWDYSLSVPGGFANVSGRLQGPVWHVGTLSFIPLPQDVARLNTSLTFPKDFSFFYFRSWEKCHEWPLTCTFLWRYMTEADIANFDENMRGYYQSIGIPYNEEEALRDNYLKMLLYMAKGQWPEHLEFIYGNYDECAGSFVFAYHGRDLLLDIAVIENLSDREISLDALWGVASQSSDLRQTGEDLGKANDVPLGVKTLPPGGKLVVPLRFRLVAGESSINWNDIAAARKVQAQIAQGDKNQVISASEWEQGFKKKRGAFGPPSSPIIKDYAYGQAIDLKGLVMGGERLMLEGSSANYLELTMAFEGGSCPYLYSWNAETEVWERHGQVIVRANDRTKERSETISFAGLKHRFQLREEELEITYLDHVMLTVHLEDGRTLTRQPSVPKLAEADRDYLLLRPGEAAELTFDVSGIEPDDVKESALMVTGFYRPFSSIMDVSRLTSSAAP